MNETVFRHGRIVLPDSVVDGAVVVRDGIIAEVGEGGGGGDGPDIDLEGDWLIPGLVELHTDHLEGHYSPRPRVRWNPVAAVQAHDAQIASSGITTVFDAIRVGMDEDTKLTSIDMQTLGKAICESQAAGRLRAEHFIHLRCEVSAADATESFLHFVEEPRVRLASLMDHTPGQRQFTSLDAFRTYYLGKSGMSESELQAFIERRLAQAEIHSTKQRQAIAEMCRERGIVLASHDDATGAHVDEALQAGAAIAEFPTTLEAARAAHDYGLAVLAGAPNLVRGHSHSGNVPAAELAARGWLDVLSSDYVPASVLHGAFLLHLQHGMTLPRAIATVSATPARRVGLEDRGAVTPGRRADLVRVRVHGDVVAVRGVWCRGERVA
jgi:alpha-D-ribose 1-methylphosphonate 5-triphosphate diphosphatase